MDFLKKHNISILCATLVVCLSTLAVYNYISQKNALLRQLDVDTENILKSVSSSISKFMDIQQTMDIQDLIKNISLELDIFEFRYLDKDGMILNSMFEKEIGKRFQRPNFNFSNQENLGNFYEDNRDMTKVLAISYPVKKDKVLVGIIDLAVDISDLDYSSSESRSFAIHRMETDVSNLVNAISSSILTSLSVFEAINFFDFLSNFIVSSENLLEIAILNKGGLVEVSTNLARKGQKMGVDFTIPQKGFAVDKGKDIYRIIDHVNPNEPEDAHLMLLMDASLYRDNFRKLTISSVGTALLGILFSLTIAFSIYRINLERAKKENIRLERMVEERTSELIEANDHLHQEVGERKKAEVALVEAKKEAESASHAKSAFLANMSHEIRTPMNAILGYAQILKRDPLLNKSQVKDLETIERSGNHLLSLINDILDISKIEAGRMEEKKIDFDLAECINDLSTMFDMRCKGKSLDWKVEGLEADEPILLHGDEGKLRQVLINLLGNAVKFTDEGFILFKVTRKQGNYFLFEIIDSGAGIPQNAQKSIFESFQQDQQGHEKGGTGLGLAISSKQVELMGGTLEVESELGEGARFFFSLLLEPAKGEVKHHSLERKVIRLAKGHQVSALVADDNKLNLDVLSRVLTDVGVHVITAENGLLALDVVRKNPIDIVFMDYRMPVMNGDEAVKQIKVEFGNKVKTVIISASAYDHEREIFQKAGCDVMLSKPFRANEVFSTIADLLKVDYEYEDDEQEKPKAAMNQTPDAPLIRLPKELVARLMEAAECYEVTKLDNALTEIKDLGPEAAQLAAYLAQLSSSYNMEGILEELKKYND